MVHPQNESPSTGRATASALALRVCLAGVVSALVACSAADRATNAAVDGGAPAPSAPADVPASVIGTLRGRVLSPDGKIPLSGAVVSLWAEAPAALAAGLACDVCVPMPRGVAHAMSNPDGTFELPVTRNGGAFFSVQKGGFRRVRPIDLVSGDQEVPAVLSTLPGKQSEGGDDIPKMAVVKGEWDPIERSLAKLGLGKLVGGEVDVTTLPFDLYDASSPTGPRSGDTLLSDPSLLAKYKVVFLPCSGSSGTTCDDTRSLKPEIQSALRQFVEGGGKLYVTDYSYEFVRQLWPGTVTFRGETKAVGSACENTPYDAPAVDLDPGLGAWLSAIGDSNVTLQKSWTTIAGVHETETVDATGNKAAIKPKVWMSAKKADGEHPATVSFERGCGRVLFSTYHTAGEAKQPLLPQEKALLYVLFEAFACVDSATPK